MSLLTTSIPLLIVACLGIGCGREESSRTRFAEDKTEAKHNGKQQKHDVGRGSREWGYDVSDEKCLEDSVHCGDAVRNLRLNGEHDRARHLSVVLCESKRYECDSAGELAVTPEEANKYFELDCIHWGHARSCARVGRIAAAAAKWVSDWKVMHPDGAIDQYYKERARDVASYGGGKALLAQPDVRCEGDSPSRGDICSLTCNIRRQIAAPFRVVAGMLGLLVVTAFLRRRERSSGDSLSGDGTATPR